MVEPMVQNKQFYATYSYSEEEGQLPSNYRLIRTELTSKDPSFTYAKVIKCNSCHATTELGHISGPV